MACADAEVRRGSCHARAQEEARRAARRARRGGAARESVTIRQPNGTVGGTPVRDDVHTRMRMDAIRVSVVNSVGRDSLWGPWNAAGTPAPAPARRDPSLSHGATRRVSAEDGTNVAAQQAADLQNAGLTSAAARAYYLSGDYFQSLHPPAVERFPEPPDPVDPDCAYRFGGDSDDCRRPPLDLQTVEDFEALDFGNAASYVDIDGATPDQEKLLLTAWAILLANTDLLDWVLCWMYGVGGGDCYIRRVFGVPDAIGLPGHVDIVVEPDACRGSFLSHAGLWGGTIKVCDSHYWSNYQEIFSSSNIRDRMCAALDLAASLCHELTHLCFRSGNDTACDCEYSYMVENLLRWCLMQRYPDAAQSPCCDYANREVSGTSPPTYALDIGRLNNEWGRSCAEFPGDGKKCL